jgi:hypothetical protein
MDTMELDHDLLLMTIPSVMSDDTGLPGSKLDGFVKSPHASLRIILRHCGVR